MKERRSNEDKNERQRSEVSTCPNGAIIQDAENELDGV
nr:MAG TPA: hypothetical protein [Caudoviricetes sp.]